MRVFLRDCYAVRESEVNDRHPFISDAVLDTGSGGDRERKEPAAPTGLEGEMPGTSDFSPWLAWRWSWGYRELPGSVTSA